MCHFEYEEYEEEEDYEEYESRNVDDDDEDDDYYIFFVDPEYGYVEDKEDCDEDYNLYDENE